MLPKAICPSCVDALRKQGIQNPVVEFSSLEGGRWKCCNCWHYVDAAELGDLVKLQLELEKHDRDREVMLMNHLLGRNNAAASKNR